MSENEAEDPQDAQDSVSGIGDDQLPDDLVAGEDNPLAEGLDDGESPGDLLRDGRPVEQDTDGEGEPAGSRTSSDDDQDDDQDDDRA